MDDLDRSDITILRMLQANARERLEDIAAETGLSIATAQRRIRAMKAAGVIIGDTAIVRPEAVGFKMTFMVMVELERERLEELEAFCDQVRKEPQVQQCYYVTGDSDFALIILARDIEGFKRLTHRLFFGNPNVKRFRTSVVMDRTKVNFTVPLDAIDQDDEAASYISGQATSDEKISPAQRKSDNSATRV